MIEKSKGSTRSIALPRPDTDGIENNAENSNTVIVDIIKNMPLVPREVRLSFAATVDKHAATRLYDFHNTKSNLLNFSR